MISNLIGLALGLAAALWAIHRQPAGQGRNLRLLASILVVGLLWLLAPRSGSIESPDGEYSPPIKTPDPINWTQRAIVGDPMQVHGMVDSTRQMTIRLTSPDGHIDSLRASGKFELRSATTAVGHWIWKLEIGRSTREVGVDVRPQPSLRLLILEGRPSFETAALARRLSQQGASVTTVTRLTASDERVTRAGPKPPSRNLSRENLASLDAVIIAPGGNGLLSAAERSLLLNEITRGLGVLHVVDTLQATSDLFPFRTTNAGLAATKVHPILNQAKVATPVAGAPVALNGGTSLIVADGGGSIARVSRQGAGAIVAMRALNATAWSLAGEDSLAATLWASVLSPTLRPARAEWRVSESAHARVDERIIVERIGERLADAVLHEGEAGPDRVPLVPVPGDSLRRRAALWPNRAGWLSLSSAGDTLWLLVATPSPAGPGRNDADLDSPLRWLAWLALLAGIAVLWRQR
ncbi:MAG: hypothetical protein ABIZ70_05175 [Gemmatimonadales bacterium]